MGPGPGGEEELAPAKPTRARILGGGPVLQTVSLVGQVGSRVGNS